MPHARVPAMCMYAHAYAHKPHMTCHHVATLAPCPPPHRDFPHYNTYFLHLLSPNLFTFVSSFICHMFVLGRML